MLLVVFNKTSSQYLQELSKDSVDTMPSLITQYIGSYNVHWKGTIVSEKYTPITCDYSLTISQTQSIFTPVVNNTPNNALKNVIYTGNLPAFIAGNLYIELIHPNKIEKVYLIAHVGIANIGDLDYISSLLLDLDNNSRSVSGAILGLTTTYKT